MKTILQIALSTLFATLAFHAEALPPSPVGPATVSLTATFQATTEDLIKSSTNHSTTTTNSSYLYKSTTTNLTISSPDILNLLANSFNTNFPAGAKLVLRGSSGFYVFFVSDSTGTNLLLNVSSVLSMTRVTVVYSGQGRLMVKSTSATSTVSGNDTESNTVYAKIGYDDSTLTTGDGTTTTFELAGVLTSKYSRNFSNNNVTDNVTLNVGGGGTIRGVPNGVIQGTIKCKLAGQQAVV